MCLVSRVSHRLAVSERALPTQIPLNPCSVAAECVVPPGETLPEGLNTEHPVCVKPRWLPRCPPVQWECCSTRFLCPRRCDAVHKPGTPSACSSQLLLSFCNHNTHIPAPCVSVFSSWLCNYPSLRGVNQSLSWTHWNSFKQVESRDQGPVREKYAARKSSWTSFWCRPYFSAASLTQLQHKHTYMGQYRPLEEFELVTNLGEFRVTPVLFTALIDLNRLLWMEYLLKCLGCNPASQSKFGLKPRQASSIDRAFVLHSHNFWLEKSKVTQTLDGVWGKGKCFECCGNTCRLRGCTEKGTEKDWKKMTPAFGWD